MEFEEQERQKRQNRHGGRGRGGGRGGRGRGGFPGFGMVDFRGGNRGRMNDQRPPLMGNMGKLVSHCIATYPNKFKGIIYLATVGKVSLSTAPLLFKSRWREHKGFTGWDNWNGLIFFFFFKLVVFTVTTCFVHCFSLFTIQDQQSFSCLRMAGGKIKHFVAPVSLLIYGLQQIFWQ